jgi:hypothetical protein
LKQTTACLFRFIIGLWLETIPFFTAATLMEPGVLQATNAAYHFVSIAFLCIVLKDLMYLSTYTHIAGTISLKTCTIFHARFFTSTSTST